MATSTYSLTDTLTNKLLSRERVRAVCVSIIAINAILLSSSFFTRDGRTPFGHNLGADFAEFYYTGEALNRGLNIYQPGTVEGMIAQVRPDDSLLPFLNPPFFAILFRPFALLPYSLAYAVWILFGVLVYVAGFQLLWPTTRL